MIRTYGQNGGYRKLVYDLDDVRHCWLIFTGYVQNILHLKPISLRAGTWVFLNISSMSVNFSSLDRRQNRLKMSWKQSFTSKPPHNESELTWHQLHEAWAALPSLWDCRSWELLPASTGAERGLWTEGNIAFRGHILSGNSDLMKSRWWVCHSPSVRG